jgi:hypothetical protein
VAESRRSEAARQRDRLTLRRVFTRQRRHSSESSSGRAHAWFRPCVQFASRFGWHPASAG